MGFEDLLTSIEGEDKDFYKEPKQNEEAQNIVLAQPETRITVDLSKFNENEMRTVNKLKEEMDLSSSNGISHFGSEIQANIAKFADGILEGVRTKDTGAVGSNLTTLLSTIQGVDMETLQEKQSVLKKIPFFGRIAKSAETTKIKLQSVTETVDRIVVSLDTAKKELIRDVNVLDTLYAKNLEYLRSLEMYIAAGEVRHKELSDTILVQLRNRAEQTQDMLDIQKYNDFTQALNEMEKRIHDLKLSREISLQTLPQIRLLQSNDKILANKIQSSILTTIPVWKNQIALSISLNKQKTALELQKKVSETTEDMLKKNAELLKMNSIEIAKESERGVISIETLRETHTKLIETITESMKIYEDGRKKRVAVEQELIQLENTQKQKLLAARSK